MPCARELKAGKPVDAKGVIKRETQLTVLSEESTRALQRKKLRQGEA